ncbi:hypothetical protein PoB_000984700 [Plakobranchus ocellatus]|uniref:Uncharacterized protein n=1 Tax=Plakobranchus ocellatus TaxID=259542 RepID=A0AAV3YKB8_9GAST|nr:hypothetical protein PoB_000984700 [Plakobranchus ocellatus]
MRYRLVCFTYCYPLHLSTLAFRWHPHSVGALFVVKCNPYKGGIDPWGLGGDGPAKVAVTQDTSLDTSFSRNRSIAQPAGHFLRIGLESISERSPILCCEYSSGVHWSFAQCVPLVGLRGVRGAEYKTFSVT